MTEVEHFGASVPHQLKPRRSGIDTRDEPVVYMRADCPICRSEGFRAHARVLLKVREHSVVATVHHVFGELIALDEAALSEAAWRRLDPRPGDLVIVAHPQPLLSMSSVRAKIFGKHLSGTELEEIVADLAAGRYSDIETAAFLTACAACPLDADEVRSLTRSMVNAGERMQWDRSPIADKHCVGGLPGNRTSPIVVAIVAALGGIMPKTSSRAITSPAGTADMMETLAPVELDVPQIRRVVERTGGCLVWGGAVRFSPADDLLIRIERALDLDSEGQLVASVLSKKIVAGATQVVLDIPVGPTAKVRDQTTAARLARFLEDTSEAFGLVVQTVISDGTQPIGRGIGPALEARDVLAILKGDPAAPLDLREKSLLLAGAALEMVGLASGGAGVAKATAALDDGRAWATFQQICEEQGGMREPPRAARLHEMTANESGVVTAIDNRKLARIAKLAGAPNDKAAGIELHVHVGQTVDAGAPLCAIHAEHDGGLSYALAYAESASGTIAIGQPE